MIRNRKISKSGPILEIVMKVNLHFDSILVIGKELKSLKITPQVFLFNKFKNVITSYEDEHNKNFIDEQIPQKRKI